MAQKYTEEVREPLMFSAAPSGWRALYIDDRPGQTGNFVVPLIDWSLFRLTVRDVETGDQLPKARTEIEGVVLQADYLHVSVCRSRTPVPSSTPVQSTCCPARPACSSGSAASFTQDSPGVGSAAEPDDLFGEALAGSGPHSATASPASRSGRRPMAPHR